MSFVSKRIATVDGRIQALAAESLPADDPVEVSFVATTPLRWYVVAPVLFVVAFPMNLAGYDAWSPVAMGLIWGAFYAAIVRQHYVVLSAASLLVIKFAPLSAKRVAEKIDLPRTTLQEVALRWRVLSGILTVKSTRRYLQLQVASPYQSRAEDLAARLAPARTLDAEKTA